MKVLLALPWKGNIRELDNVIEHAMILGSDEWITLADLPRSVPREASDLPAVGDNLKEAVRSYSFAPGGMVMERLVAALVSISRSGARS